MRYCKKTRDFVKMYEFNYYTEMAEGVRKEQMNYAKVAEIGEWFMKRLAREKKNGIN